MTAAAGDLDRHHDDVTHVGSEVPVEVARTYRVLEPLHAMIYFAPEAEQELTAVGLRPGRMCYFASRAAAMGAVTAGVTAATFYNFNPDIVARHVPRAWSLASIPDILAARLRAADRALRRLLGDAVDTPEVVEAADLVRHAAAGLPGSGRPLHAGHAELPWPDDPHLVLWHGVTLLREFRGDGHVAALLDAGISGLDALVTHVATGRGLTAAAARTSRGWSDDQWAAAERSLAERDLLDTEGLRPDGVALRAHLEVATDRLSAAPWQSVGAERTARLAELGRALSRRALAAGAFPPGVFATR